MSHVTDINSRQYTATPFSASTVYGEFKISGTLCGGIDLAVPQGDTLTITPDEALMLIIALKASRDDVLANSRPSTDKRIVTEA